MNITEYVDTYQISLQNRDQFRMPMYKERRLIDSLIRTLQESGEKVLVRETHISWVLLFGKRAWKIKKPVNFGFLDFSTPEKRRQACEEEIRLNRRFAADLYLNVMEINGSVDQPEFQSDSAAIEYAVVMRRFDESNLLSVMAERCQLSPGMISSIANSIAALHQSAPVEPSEANWGNADQIHHWLTESLEHIRNRVSNREEQQQISNIEHQCRNLYQQMKTQMQVRSESGFVRECHGDLHLGNMIWQEEKLLPFDCIEFNPALRWIDVISEAAFVMMDLEERDYRGFAWRFINRYLVRTGDYAGVSVLRYYFVYRALVRAKVSLLQAVADETPTDTRLKLKLQYTNYISLSERWLTQYRPVLMITHGLSASGKSTIAAMLSEEYGCIHIRSDIERKRLHGLPALANSHAELKTGIYTDANSEHTYQCLFHFAQQLLTLGYPVIIDAAFLEQSRRQHFQQLANDIACPYLILHCEADETILATRIEQRQRQHLDPSEATLSVLNEQICRQQPLMESEPFVIFSPEYESTLPDSIAEQLNLAVV